MRNGGHAFFGLVVACIGELIAPGSSLAAQPDVRVVLYHRVGDARYPSTNVSQDAFRAQMQWLRDEGFTVVPTRSVEDFLLGRGTIPPRAVAIHFDDGYRSVYDSAFPVLRALGYPFTVFLPTEALDRSYPDYVTWEMVQSMAEAGGSFGAHGHHHERLSFAEEGRARGAQDLVLSRSRIEAHGLEARWAAYPYGEYTPAFTREVRDDGFALGFSQDPGAIGAGTAPFRLPRFAVVGAVSDMETFRERMRYLPLDLDDPRPAPGWLTGAAVLDVSTVIPGADQFVPGVVNVFVSEWGRLDASFDVKTGRVEAMGKGGVSRRINRVLVSLRDRASGRYGLGSWLLLTPSGTF